MTSHSLLSMADQPAWCWRNHWTKVKNVIYLLLVTICAFQNKAAGKYNVKSNIRLGGIWKVNVLVRGRVIPQRANVELKLIEFVYLSISSHVLDIQRNRDCISHYRMHRQAGLKQ